MLIYGQLQTAQIIFIYFLIFLGENPWFEVKNVRPMSLLYCIISVLRLSGFFRYISNFSTIAAKWLRKKLLKTQMQIRIVPSENIFNPLCGACASNIRKSLMATSHAKRQISEIAILQFSGYQQSQGCLVSFSIKTRWLDFSRQLQQYVPNLYNLIITLVREWSVVKSHLEQSLSFRKTSYDEWALISSYHKTQWGHINF